MELNINSLSYDTREYGVDEDIYWMCRKISDYMKEKKYSDFINIIGAVPIAAPVSEIEKGLYKRSQKCEPPYGFASVSLPLDYEEYIGSDIPL